MVLVMLPKGRRRGLILVLYWGFLENPWTCIGEDRAEVMHGKIKDRAGIL